MAEFQDVMRQWGRLCRQHCAENADDCDGCLLGGTRADVCGSYARDNAEDVEELERLVMEWAEENPEPQYPTWKEWLEEQRVVVHFDSVNNKGTKVKWELTNRSNCPIPADMAQKLGIEPKK